MKKTIGLFLCIVGFLGTVGFIYNITNLTLEHGLAYFIGRVSPIFLLGLGIYLLKNKKSNYEI